MTEERIREIQNKNESENVNAQKKGKKKGKLRLKKSVRRTAGALLLTTSLIVAAIPVSDAKALTPDTGNANEIPTLDAIIADTTQYYHVGPAGTVPDMGGATKSTSVKSGYVSTNPDTYRYGFPYKSDSDVSTVYDADGTPHEYYEINMNNMLNSYPVPIYRLSTFESGVQFDCIDKYIGGGGSGYSPQDSTINLGDIVIYQDGVLHSDKTTELVPLGEYFNRKPTADDPVCTRYTEYCHNLQTDFVTEGYQVLKLDVCDVTYKYEEQQKTDPLTDDPMFDPVTGNPIMETVPVLKPGTSEHDYDVTGTTTTYYTVKKSTYNQSQIYYIADDAFNGVTNFNTIKIPSGITKIGNKAFYGNSGLQSVELLSDIEFLGIESFAGCSGLTNVTFKPETSLKYIADGAFANTGLPSITIPHSVLYMGSGVFYGCESLQDASMNGSELTPGIFSAYTSAYEPVIGDYFFANCKAMTMSKLATGMRQIGKKNANNTTGYGVYAGCTNLQYVDLPEKFGDSSANQTTLSQEFFSGCNKLTWIRFFGPNAKAFEGDFITENNKEYHGTGAVPNVPNSFAIWGPDPDTNPAAFQYAIKAENSNTYMYFDEAEGKFKYLLVQGGYRFEFDETGKVTEVKYKDGTAASADVKDKLEIPTQIGDLMITELGDKAFNALTEEKPTSIEIPDTITKIGNECFRDCGDVKKIDCKTKGVDIGEFAFAENPKLEEFNFDQTDGNGGVTNLGKGTFQNCPKLEQIAFRNDDCHGDAYYDVNIGSVGEKAFYTQGDKLTMIGKMEPGYAPYDFAIDPTSTFSPRIGSHILYKSGNPQGLACQYVDPQSPDEEGYVALKEFPDQETVIYNDGTQSFTVSKLYDMYKVNPANITYNMLDIINDTMHIKIPKGITRIDYMSGETQEFATSTGKRYNAFRAVPGLQSVTFEDDMTLYDEAFALYGTAPVETDLTGVAFDGDVVNIGKMPFNVPTGSPDGISKLTNVIFGGEQDTGTPENPRYFFENGIIYADTGENLSIIECLSARGAGIGQTAINAETDPCIAGVTALDSVGGTLEMGPFYNCDHIMDVDLSAAEGLKNIPSGTFSECDNLLSVELNKNVNEIEDAFTNAYDYITVTIPSQEIDISDTAFKGVNSPTLKSYENYAAQRYVKRMNKKPGNNFNFVLLDKKASLLVRFLNYDGTVLKTQTVEYEKNATPPEDPVREGYIFDGWKPSYLGVTDDTTCIAQFKAIPSSSSSSSSGPSSTTPSGSTNRPSGSTSGSTSKSSSSSSSSNSSTSTSISHPIILSGANAGGVVNSAGGAAAKPSSGSSNSGSSKPSGGAGKTSVVSTADGITDVGKMSATVNGSSDNYVVKITQTEEANNMALQALQAAFGDLEPIRYLPIDISLYDSTGTNKISPIPEGTSISITMPIPDDLAIYGGNAKVASTVNGNLEKIQPRFTVINSVPCMTYTVTHLSPYVIYVDTANLTEAGISDVTPKTADPIHPKWFLCIGLAAVAVVLFLKKDPEEYLRKQHA